MNYFKKSLPITGSLVFGLLALFTVSCSSVSEPALPETPVRAVVDTLQGVEITDNYRWLEEGDNPEVVKWENQQDEYCRYQLKRYPQRDQLQNRIDELMKIGYIDSPVIRGGKYFYMKRMGDEDHSILYLKRAVDSEAEVVVDPNTFSADGTVAMDWWFVSPEGKYIAFGKSSSGTENSTLYLIEVDTRELLPDTIPYARAVSIAWLNDNSGFYYTRYPEPGTVPEGDEAYFRRIYFHDIGADYENDPLVFGEDLDRSDWPGVLISPDNRYLVIVVYQGWSKSEVYLRDLHGDGDFRLLTSEVDAMFSPYPLDDALYIFTNYKAPKYRLMKGSYYKPELKSWRELVPEGESIKEYFAIVGDNIIVTELHNASSRLSIHGRDGRYRKDVPLPEIGSIVSYSDHVLGAEIDGNELLFAYNSYFIPPTLYRYDFVENELTVFDEIEAGLDLSNLKVEQIWFPSKDSTMVSMFLTHRKDLKLDGNNPALVYGYGGFSGKQTPYFSRTRTMFLSKGGILADTQLRGGGEYGEEWHRDGMLDKKQNVFDDFIAACEWLIENKYTNPDRIVIEGGSNGGLLVGAVMVQRPDLMKAVVCGRPLLDMLRYHKFLIGELWVPEYGSAENPEQFSYLYAYSPYHNVRPGTAYPAILIESADHDTRCDPLHARKMIASLQSATSSDAPILLRVQKKTGHGMGAPRRIVIEELVDEWTFVFEQLGM